MNNNSYIFYGTESEWTQNASRFDFPYIAYTNDAGNVYISPFEGGGGEQPEPVYQTFTYTRQFSNFKYLRDGSTDPAGLYAVFNFVFNDSPFSSDTNVTRTSNGWQLVYNTTSDTLTLSKQFTVDTSLTLQEQIASIDDTQVELYMNNTTSNGGAYYDNMGIELIWQGNTTSGQYDLFAGSLASAVSDYITQSSASAITNISLTEGMDALFEPDPNGSGTPFIESYNSFIYFTGLNTIYDGTGVRDTSIPMRLVFNGQTRDFTVGGNNVYGDFNGLNYMYSANGNDAGKLQLLMNFDCDVALTDAEKIALLSNTDYTLYYTGSNIYTQAGDEYQCDASSDSNGYILAQFSEYDMFVQNGTVTESTQTYNIWDNFQQASGGSESDTEVTITYEIQNIDDIYLYTDEEEGDITVIRNSRHTNGDNFIKTPMQLCLYDTRLVDPMNFDPTDPNVHYFTLDDNFTTSEFDNVTLTYSSHSLTASYTITVPSGYTTSDFASDDNFNYEIRILPAPDMIEALHNTEVCNSNGDIIDVNRIRYDDYTTIDDYIIKISPQDCVDTDTQQFIGAPSITVDLLTDTCYLLKDYFYIEYSANGEDGSTPRPNNNVLKFEYSNWESTTPDNVNSFTLEYSMDHQQTWNTLSISQNHAGQILIPRELNGVLEDLRVYFRSTSNADLINGISNNQYYSYTFKNTVSSGFINSAGGNIMSLIYGEQAIENNADFINDYPIPTDYCFNSLFRDMTSLQRTGVWLPAALTEGCYVSMYQNTGLIESVTVDTPEYDMFGNGARAYSHMFRGCTNLGSVELTASFLYDYEFSYMFYGCTSLGQINLYSWAGPASGKTGCTDYWLNNVSSSGVIHYEAGTDLSSLPINSSSGIPSGWTATPFEEEE